MKKIENFSSQKSLPMPKSQEISSLRDSINSQLTKIISEMKNLQNYEQESDFTELKKKIGKTEDSLSELLKSLTTFLSETDSKIQNSLSLSEILQILERCSTENSRDFQETLTLIKRINRQVEAIDTSQKENLTLNTSPTKGCFDETNTTILEDINDRSRQNSKSIRDLVEIDKEDNL